MRATSNGTVRRLVFDFGVPVTHSRRNRVLVRCTRIEPLTVPSGAVLRITSQTSNP